MRENRAGGSQLKITLGKSQSGLPICKFEVAPDEHAGARGYMLKGCRCGPCCQWFYAQGFTEKENEVIAERRRREVWRGEWYERYFSLAPEDLLFRMTSHKKLWRMWMIHMPSSGLGISMLYIKGFPEVQMGQCWRNLARHPNFVKWWLDGRRGML